MKKSSLLTFCFAFIPGAGQMYLGMMKRGVSLMLLFSLSIAIPAFLSLPFLAIFAPVIWFYAFFDTFNIRSMSYEQRVVYEDRFLFGGDGALYQDWFAVLRKRHALVGGGCILLGVYMLYNIFLGSFSWRWLDYFPYLRHLLYNLPTLLVAVLIIFIGIRMLGGRKKKLPPPEEDYVEYGGKEHE